MSRVACLMALMLLFAATGCTTRLVDFTVISTKNVDLSKASTFTRGQGRVMGEDMIHIIVFIPTGVSNMKEAIDRAIEVTPGAVALVDGVVLNKFFYIPYIYGRGGYVVEGTPLISPNSSAESTSELSSDMAIYLDEEGNVKERRALSPEEYGKLKQATLPKRR